MEPPCSRSPRTRMLQTTLPWLPWTSGGAIIFGAVMLGAPFAARHHKQIIAVLLTAVAITLAAFSIACSSGGTGSAVCETSAVQRAGDTNWYRKRCKHGTSDGDGYRSVKEKVIPPPERATPNTCGPFLPHYFRNRCLFAKRLPSLVILPMHARPHRFILLRNPEFQTLSSERVA